MNDEPHDTRPIWEPPNRAAQEVGQAPAAQQPGPAPSGQPGPYSGYPDHTRPLPLGGRPPAGRVPGWLWPIVAVTALLLGLVGGVAGSVVWDRIRPDDDPAGGLEQVDTVSDPPLPADNGSIASVAQKVLPSTVKIQAQVQGESGGATGSGFVLDRQGHVVTNNHVVAEAGDGDGAIRIIDADGYRYDATLVGRSTIYDLAVLEVPEAKKMQPLSLGSAERLRIGDGVVAVGSPLGLSSTVTYGIVSALDRPVTTGSSADDTSYINAVQTDAAINPGNSGGPLVNMRGQVVGVNSAIATAGGFGEAGNIGVGFAIPVEQVRVTADQILSDGEARYPVIGAKVDTRPTDDPGATVSEILPGTPAERAGLKAGDVVTEVEGERVEDGRALVVAIRTHQPGEKVEFTIERDGQQRTVTITLDSEVG